MCYQVDVISLEDNQAIITIGESKFLAYHETEVEVSEGFDDCWDYARESHYTKSNGKHEVDARTILNSLYVIVHEDGDEMLDIHITATLDKMLVKAIEHAIALAAISQKEKELENAANSFDWSVGHVSHYYC